MPFSLDAAQFTPIVSGRRSPRRVEGSFVRNGSADRVNFIWSVADLLRGDYKQSEYGKVILPLVIIRRLDCVLEPTKNKVIAEYAQLKGRISNVEPILLTASGESFYNTSPLTFQKLLDDPERIADNLRAYINGFSPGALEVITHFGFDTQITTLDKAGLLYLVIGKFADTDLHPDVVSNHDMGYIFEELIRRFSEQSNETAGEHFTPREVIELMVNLLFATDTEALSVPGTRRTLYDPTAGTGGMLSVAETYLRKLNPDARLIVFGQELNPESYAICRADMMLKGQDPTHIALGNTLTQDAFRNERFAYMLSNPPFGVDWKKAEKEVRKEAGERGYDGRFGAGLPRITDGSFLFLQHMISKMRPVEDGGSRIAIVFNASPLFSGDAGSGESEIRRWIIEHDWLEAIVALPNQLFYNTPLHTYFWIVTNRKSAERQGKIQLIDARDLFSKMRPSLGDKRNKITEAHMAEVVELYRAFEANERSLIFESHAFGFQRVTVEQPLRLRYEVDEATIAEAEASSKWLKLAIGEQEQLRSILGTLIGLSTTELAAAQERVASAASLTPGAEKVLWEAISVRDEAAPVVTDKKGKAHPDPNLRDFESIPLPAVSLDWEADPNDRLASAEYRAAVQQYMADEVLPYTPEAWLDLKRIKIGYEIPLTRLFYRPAESRPLDEVDADIRRLEADIRQLFPETMS